MAQTIYPAINKEIINGNYSIAKQMIEMKLASDSLTELQEYNLKFQADKMKRIRLDFSRDENYVRQALNKYFPELTEEQLQKWESDNDLEMKIIDGQKKYFRNAVPNLFRKNKEAKKVKETIDGKYESSLDQFLKSYIPDVVKAGKEKKQKLVLPKKIKITYTLTVDANRVPEDEIIRAWLPFPRSDRSRLQDVRLLSTSEPDYIIAPESYPHKSIYMEKRAVKDQPTLFMISYQYTAFNEWNNINEQKAGKYNIQDSLFRKYTEQRETHIIFTPELKSLSEKIIGNENDPIEKARLLYTWIGKNIPWTSALEYSIIDNIPMYCIQNMRGDCGIKAMLFITLCRYNGIPAKWQSGWYVYPGNLNLHDWAEIYFAGIGWVPVDPDFNNQDIAGPDAKTFFFGNTDAYRLIINDDFSGDFFPAKVYPRSETVDFQRGEAEWKGGNLYFNTWDYHMDVEYLN